MSNTQGLSELKSDLSELETILVTVTRSNVRRIIANEISNLKSNIESLEQKQRKEAEKTQNKTEIKEEQKPLYTKKLTNYAVDETPKFVKLYVTVPSIEKLTLEQIKCDFTDVSFKFIAHDHLGKNFLLQILKLAHKINPTESTCRIKNGNVIIALRKIESKTWGQITEAERKEKETKDAVTDTKDSDVKADDPSGGIMNLMKKMYDDGDDNMKRMIKKTWYETQQKQKDGSTPDMGGMPDMSGMGGMPDMSGMGGMAGMMAGMGGMGGMPDMSGMQGTSGL